MSNKLPNELVRRLSADKSFDTEAFVTIHETTQKSNSIRINPAKKADITHLKIDKQVPWCNEGYYLSERPIYTLDPLFHAGCYYVQEASSMFLTHAIHELGLHQSPTKALDLCAAPGGKSTLLNAALHPESLLVANEIIKSRVTILADNLMKWGNPNVVVTNNDPSAFNRLPGYFDLMVVDAPCSGSGMFRKDSTAIDEWSEANVKLCSERQRRILAASMASLKTNGYLFYSTCSYSTEENEDIVDWLIAEFDMISVPLKIKDEWQIAETISAKHHARSFRFYPHKIEGEGFFFAVLQKRKIQDTFSMKGIKSEKSDVPRHILQKWLRNDNELFVFAHQDNIHILPSRYELDLKALRNVLYFRNVGTQIGKVAGKELIPSHDLALSNYILAEIPFLELDLEDVLNFLRKEVLSVELNTTGKVGWILIKYKGMNLGWIKAMPNRINNYYPKEIRIVNL
ncbi:methyltransferase RsmF C-terminal domain-like protein [Sphingobacterium lumbrici]|uniref:methyltransferase RsmF C-terminal domain-like protein n=1 Tax=Sphingobacterium lumbrici TaxID=2559600 RepID=UPI001129AFB3|nr:RNA methyltransferase [Sphingobacterium lumbrici]